MQRLPGPEFLARAQLAEEVQHAQRHASTFSLVHKADKHLGRMAKLHRERTLLYHAALAKQGAYR